MTTKLCVVFPIFLVGVGLSAQRNPHQSTVSVVTGSMCRSLGGKRPTDLPCSSNRCLLALDVDSGSIGSTFSSSFVEPETSSYSARFSPDLGQFVYIQIERGAMVLPIELAPKQGPPATDTNC